MVELTSSNVVDWTVGIILAAVLAVLVRRLYQYTKKANAEVKEPSTTRFEALDVFRGATICLMVFVNYGGRWSSQRNLSGWLVH